MTEEKKDVAPKEIIRGRMPVVIVYLARFGAQSTQPTKVKADVFGTTVGKIDDIAKGRNFSYVTSAFKPTAAQKADGKAWLERHPTGASQLIAELEALPEATAEEAAEFEKVRGANRGQAATDADGKPVNAGGGNRRGKKAKNEDAASDVDSAASAEALLS